MAAKALISQGYRWRLFAIAIGCLAFAGWSAYDGFVAYPLKNQYAATFEQYKQDHGADWVNTWEPYANEHGIPIEPDPPKSQFSMIAQYVQMGITLPIGLLFGYVYLSTMGRWIASSEQGLTSSRKQNISYEAIRTLNKARWNSKGIAVVCYDAGDRERRLVLDDWKFNRAMIGVILADVEAQLSDDQIVGGVREPDPAASASANSDSSAS